MKISVITPTIRKEGLDIVKKGLSRQTEQSFEWLIGSPFDPGMGTWVKDGFTGGYWTLNRIMNKQIKEAKGNLIVSIQDYTYFNPDALEKFLYYYEQNPSVIVSGIGDKYSSVDPLGVKMWSDPRRVSGFGKCPFYFIEGNFCAFPRKVVTDLGGFDEEMDNIGYGLDFYSLWDRVDIKGGYDFMMDTTNESFSLEHGRVKDWDEKNINAQDYMELRSKYLKNPVLNYLS